MDPTVVIFALANSKSAVYDDSIQDMARKLAYLSRPEKYNIERGNNFNLRVSEEEMAKLESPPCLSDFVTAESWLVFELLDHSNEKTNWLKQPPYEWTKDKYYLEFQDFVQKIAVVNDSAKQTVKLVQETIQVFLQMTFLCNLNCVSI